MKIFGITLIELAKNKSSKIHQIFFNFGVKLFKHSTFLGKLNPFIRNDKNSMRFIPINKDIKVPPSTPIPTEMIDKLIDKATHIVRMDNCLCRFSCQCKKYPIDIGCLHLGKDAILIPTTQKVSPAEARSHVRKAIEAGLVPYVGRTKIDYFLYGLNDKHQMMTLCFCCECCCISRSLQYLPFNLMEPSYTKLDGITIKLNPELCKGCGTCAKNCFINAISIIDKKAVINEYCRACGRCASVCKQKAIQVEINNPEYLEKSYHDMIEHVKIE